MTLVKVGLEYDRPVPEAWERAVWSVAPPSNFLSWLKLVWEPVERWMIYQMRAPRFVRPEMLKELRGPSPRSTGHYCAPGWCECAIKKNGWRGGADDRLRAVAAVPEHRPLRHALVVHPGRSGRAQAPAGPDRGQGLAPAQRAGRYPGARRPALRRFRLPRLPQDRATRPRASVEGRDGLRPPQPRADGRRGARRGRARPVGDVGLARISGQADGGQDRQVGR